jgi:hypothetical protein
VLKIIKEGSEQKRPKTVHKRTRNHSCTKSLADVPYHFISGLLEVLFIYKKIQPLVSSI